MQGLLLSPFRNWRELMVWLWIVPLLSTLLEPIPWQSLTQMQGFMWPPGKIVLMGTTPWLIKLKPINAPFQSPFEMFMEFSPGVSMLTQRPSEMFMLPMPSRHILVEEDSFSMEFVTMLILNATISTLSAVAVSLASMWATSQSMESVQTQLW